MLKQDRGPARSIKQASAAVRATELLGNDQGMFVERSDIRISPLDALPFETLIARDRCTRLNIIFSRTSLLRCHVSHFEALTARDARVSIWAVKSSGEAVSALGHEALIQAPNAVHAADYGGYARTRRAEEPSLPFGYWGEVKLFIMPLKAIRRYGYD